MNDERINKLVENIKNDPSPSGKAVNDFIEKNLTESQANAIQNVLKNPGLINSILDSPQAKQILERLGKKGEE